MFKIPLPFLLFALTALAQQCPTASGNGAEIPSAARTLSGKLIFHDGIRQWFELKLDKPECDVPSLQLTTLDKQSTALETLRGCRVQSTGAISTSPTGYYSLEKYQEVKRIEPEGDCTKQPPFPDYSKSKPDPSVRAYRVDMSIDYSKDDHPIRFRVSSAGRPLAPWQAYARYQLTGGFVFYGECADGFMVDQVFGAAKANPGHFEEKGSPGDMAEFDPESAAEKGPAIVRLGYTCIRKR